MIITNDSKINSAQIAEINARAAEAQARALVEADRSANLEADTHWTRTRTTQVQAETLIHLINGGFNLSSAIEAVTTNDLTKLTRNSKKENA